MKTIHVLPGRSAHDEEQGRQELLYHLHSDSGISPAGTTDNSPGFQAGVTAMRAHQVPQEGVPKGYEPLREQKAKTRFRAKIAFAGA